MNDKMNDKIYVHDEVLDQIISINEIIRIQKFGTNYSSGGVHRLYITTSIKDRTFNLEYDNQEYRDNMFKHIMGLLNIRSIDPKQKPLSI